MRSPAHPQGGCELRMSGMSNCRSVDERKRTIEVLIYEYVSKCILTAFTHSMICP